MRGFQCVLVDVNFQFLLEDFIGEMRLKNRDVCKNKGNNLGLYI